MRCPCFSSPPHPHRGSFQWLLLSLQPEASKGSPGQTPFTVASQQPHSERRRSPRGRKLKRGCPAGLPPALEVGSHPLRKAPVIRATRMPKPHEAHVMPTVPLGFTNSTSQGLFHFLLMQNSHNKMNHFIKCAIQWHWAHSQSHAPTASIWFFWAPPLQKEACPHQQLPLAPLAQPLATTDLLSLSKGFSLLDS